MAGYFGCTGTPVSVWLRFGMRLVVFILRNDDKAKVQLPVEEEIQAYKGAVLEKHDLLRDVYCVADGLKLDLQQSGNVQIQGRFYNGWNHGHYVSNVFVFAPNGTIIACVLNCPGAMHNSAIAHWGNLYEKLKFIWDRYQGKCVVDSAFDRTNNNFIIKSAQDVGLAGTREEALMNEQATSLRQAANGA